MREVLATVRQALRDAGLDVVERDLTVPPPISAIARRLDAVLQSRGRYREDVHVLGELGCTIACDISGTQTVLGYRPQVELLDGMRRAVRWCLDAGLPL